MLFEVLYTLHKRTRLGGRGFYPVPNYLRPLFSKYPIHKRVHVYARLVKDTDLSFIAPDDVGCAESVTRLLREVDPTLSPVILGTYTLLEHLRTSPRFKEIGVPINGCLVLAATGTGNGTIQGHVGIFDNGRVWSNNSYKGVWDAHFTLQAFKARYTLQGGMKVRHFIPITNK